MKRLNTLLLALTMITVALAGCNDAPEEEEVILPGSISEEQVEELEERALEQFPRVVEFPDQVLEEVEPIIGAFEGRLSPGEGGGYEFPNDNGQLSIGGEIKTFDINSVADIADYQPVEIRLKLKWWGDPGSSVDMDIYVDVPGENDGYDPVSDDESWNWNIVTKFRVINTIKLPGENLLVGMHLQNAKNPHPDGVQYQLSYEVHQPANVLAPKQAYAIKVPDDANILIFESEPVVGDEHVTSQVVVVDPQDNVVIDKWHNDIATETYSVPVRGGGEYVVYAKYMHGGFLRVETDVQNPDYQARRLDTSTTEVSVGGSAPAPAPSGYAESGAFGAPGTVLDAYAYIRAAQPVASEGVVTMAVINNNGDYHVLTTTGKALDGEAGRVGPEYTDSRDWESPDAVTTLAGEFTWGFTNNAGAGFDAGYGYVTYTR